MNFEKSELHDRIEDFLDGKFSEKEKIQFIEQMKTDKELERQYRQRIELAENWVKATKYESAHNQIAELIRQEKSHKKNRLFVWSVAASFLILVSVSGIVMFSDRNSKQESIVQSGEGLESPVVPQIKQAEEKASIHFNGKLKMLSPIKNKLCNLNDSIVFSWNSEVDAETNITIENRKNGKTVFRERIKVKAQRFVLEKNFLPEGEYQWLIEGFPEKEKFNVVLAGDEK